MTVIISCSPIVNVLNSVCVSYLPKSVCDKVFDHVRSNSERKSHNFVESVQESAWTGQLSWWIVTHLRIYLTSLTLSLSVMHLFLRLFRLLDTLRCRADGKENKRTWEKRCQGVRVCSRDKWRWVSLRSEDACWCSTYCAHPLLPMHTHNHTCMHKQKHYASMTSLVKVKEVKVPEDWLYVADLVCSHDMYGRNKHIISELLLSVWH